MAYLNANLSETQELGVYQPLPPGDYEVTIINSEIRETKKGEQQVVFIYEVSAGEHAGAQVYDRLSLWNTDQKVSGMAQRRLKSIAIACGHPNPNYVADTSEFHGRRMITRLAIREYNGSSYQDVKAYISLSPRQPAPAGHAAPPPQPAPLPSEVHSVKPWE